ncbi:alpha-amylase family glycosyl hydrolase [Cesiribacter sp. SM1]|uniref:alpha-amylase family glycosyl hydrolase n=1 Tax=Cesiribacter sp. SM1 TaxID=2861196 RepID=UPI001CD722BD|nr:alpha-amylase family glycosyl hydrolase [Cesiribacter sp. SM1]
MAKATQDLWWKSGIIYEVYARSFQDSNGDGIGDIRGLIQRLDYLQWLGVNAVWLTPVYPSPMKDLGYDISDYTGIDPVFGKLNDFEELLNEVHSRGMKLVVDFIPNHSSDHHPWFQESRSSKDNPKRNWYIWKDAGPDGAEPNNWLSVLGGPAWAWDKHTGQYYYHTFLKEQPELNLRNPDVLKAMLEAMRFWLDKGVDGFRVDVMWYLIKDEKFRDNPVNPDYKPDMPSSEQLIQAYSSNQPGVHDIVRQFRKLLDEYSEKVMIGELYLSINKIVDYYGANNGGAHLPGNHQLLLLPWEVKKVAAAIDKYEAALPDGAWPNWVIGNHDQPRVLSRIGRGQAKVAAMLLLSLRGTPIMYYGDEIGMENVEIPREEQKDPQGLLMENNKSRDPQRTPMQWDASENAGFTTGKPWLRLPKSFEQQNVEAQKKDPHSLLNFYRQLIQLRQKEPALMMGDYYPVLTDGKLLAYIRRGKGSTSFLLVLNMTDKAVDFKPKDRGIRGRVVLSTNRDWEEQELETGSRLEANEGVLARLADT